jgi:hypothetical protein
MARVAGHLVDEAARRMNDARIGPDALSFIDFTFNFER